MTNKAYDVTVDDIQFYEGGLIVSWYGAVGYGQISFQKDECGKLTIDSEYMTPEFIKAVLNKMVDKAIIT